MASPMKSGPGARANDPQYVPVATADISPDPNSPVLSNARSSTYLSPDPNDALLNRRDSDLYPAPSILSRDSTHASLPGTPALLNNRDSWGSNAALAAGAGHIAGAPNFPRQQSGLRSSSIGWNNTTRDIDDDEQGHITPAAAAGPATMSEKPRWAEAGSGSPKKSRKWLWIGLGAGVFLILAGAGVGLGIGYVSPTIQHSWRSADVRLTRNRNNRGSGNNSAGSSGNDNVSTDAPETTSAGSTPSATTSAPQPTATTGGQGSLLTFEDGTTMTYENSFGGTWVWDPANPFNNAAQANSWTPPLNQNWTWGEDSIYGVNLGGWLVTEPFIVSSLYETYNNGPAGLTVDEYTLSINMGNNLTNAMTEHYETFITERDIAEIATAGLNWIRIPIGHWAVATIPGEPYLEGVSWNYFLKAVQWCRKYGIRINLDLHTAPGSQNGWNHSGRLGTINWMNGVMGVANAQRSLDVMRTLAQFITQPEYLPVIPLFGFLNEPNGQVLSHGTVGSFYSEAYQMLREVTGTGAGNGAFLSMHDAFQGPANWVGFLPGADRLAIDQHPYMAFQNQQTGPLSTIENIPCNWWSQGTNTSSNAFGVTISGEWSIAINDCGHWVNSVQLGSRYDGTFVGYTGPTGGSCDQWNDWPSWDNATKEGLMQVALASMDALQNWFFWTWKIGNSTTQTPAEVNPFWHYRLGWLNGWMPTDPRAAAGTCVGQGVPPVAFDGTYASPYMTGGAGAGTIAAAQFSSYPWPAASFISVPAAQMTLLPQYTPTASPVTLSPPTFTSPGSTATIPAGNGWANPNDSPRSAFTPIAGCAYPPEYSAASLAPTASACGATLPDNVLKRSPAPTAPPSA